MDRPEIDWDIPRGCYFSKSLQKKAVVVHTERSRLWSREEVVVVAVPTSSALSH